MKYVMQRGNRQLTVTDKSEVDRLAAMGYKQVGGDGKKPSKLAGKKKPANPDGAIKEGQDNE